MMATLVLKKLDGYLRAGKSSFMINKAGLPKLKNGVHYDIFKMI